MDRQVIRQPSGRGDGLPVPGPHGQRVASGGNRLQQRARKQGQAEASLHRCRTPRPRQLPRTRPVGAREVGLDGPAMSRGDSALCGGQLTGGRADQQGAFAGWGIHRHHLNAGLRRLPAVQGPPPAPAPRARLNTERQVFIRASFWPLRPRMPYGSMQRRATPLAGASGGGHDARRGSCARAPPRQPARSPPATARWWQSPPRH